MSNGVVTAAMVSEGPHDKISALPFFINQKQGRQSYQENTSPYAADENSFRDLRA